MFRSQRFGHRRAWILGTQLIMAATLGMLVFVKLPEQLALFTAILLVHNTFAAMQDVAIDALACNTLHPEERGLANGLMFAGAAVGQAVGGSGVLFLMAYIGFQNSFVFVALSILAVTGFVVMPMKEALAQAGDAASQAGRGLRHALGEMRSFAMDAFRSFIGTRGAYAGVFFALLPCGAMSLSLALQSNLSVELGLNDDQVAWMNLATSVISGVAMVLGGMLSDRIGRRVVLSAAVVLMSLPVAYLALVLQQHGYVMPRAADSKAAVEPALVTALWVAVLAFNVFMGLMYGVRSALFMDVTNPKVAATQFTAYMALMNLSIAYTATWQGLSIEAFGYPVTLAIDATVGLFCLALMHLMKKPASEAAQVSDSLAEHRARKTAWGLGLLCLSWLPFWALRAELGAALPIANVFFTMLFVISPLFLLAGREVLGQGVSPMLRKAAAWLALPLLAIYGRKWVEGLQAGVAPWAQSSTGLMLTDGLIYLLPLLAGLLLIQMARQDWQALSPKGVAGATL